LTSARAASAPRYGSACWTCQDMFAGRVREKRKRSQQAYDDGGRKISRPTGGVSRQWTLRP
jgi:hypothetical protein